MTLVANSVCAVVITYRPEPDTLDNLAAVRLQVEGLVVVDNGSVEGQLAALRQASVRIPFQLIENNENLGIAAALNIGVRWAQSKGYRYVALFDQDSTVTDGFIQAMLEMYQSHPNRKGLGMIGAAHRHRITGQESDPGLLARDGGPLEVMTSGTLIPTDVFGRCGYFQEDLIIDLVDYEYCFRIRDGGYIISYCPDALLIHAAGSPAHLELFGKTIMAFGSHSAARWYYIARNSFLLLQRYGRRYPRWAMATLAALLIKAPIKILLVKGGRWEKLRNILCGLMDGARGRTGMRVKL
jgi:rhamnosyltransferase